MSEFIVIGESGADARIATKLAERVLIEKIDWLDDDTLQYYFQWTGLEEGTEYSEWTNINKIVESFKSSGLNVPRYRGHHSHGVPLEADGASARKVLKLVLSLQKKLRIQIKAVIFIRDIDHEPERKIGLEQARLEHSKIDIEQARLENINQIPKLEIVIGIPDRNREAWVLNGFIPSNQKEQKLLEEIKSNLTFDPCTESHRLRANLMKEPERNRNTKVVLKKLTQEDIEREKQCWEDTSLEILRERGVNTGLTDYLQEVEQRLVAIILSL